MGHSSISLWTGGIGAPGSEAMFQKPARSPKWLFTNLSSFFIVALCHFSLSQCLVQSTVHKINLHLGVLMQFSKTGYLLFKTATIYVSVLSYYLKQRQMHLW